MASVADILNSYILPGHARDARVGIFQAQEAERLGLRGVFLSERWETKELGSVIGALTQATDRINLVAGLTHFGTRHPLVLAGMGATMQTLSNGRFILGFARGVPAEFKKLGITTPNLVGMAEHAKLLRRLWTGETITYDGPAGSYPALQLAHICNNPPPLILGAVGPKTLKLAGEHFDGVVLSPLLSCEGVRRSAAIVRNAALSTGRDPSKITIYATIVTAPDTLSESERADIVEARAVSYFMHREVGLQLVRMNGWDEEPMNRLSSSGLAQLDYGAADIAKKRRLMSEAAKTLPSEWLTTGTVSGAVDHCIERYCEYLASGADEILIHGTTPERLSELVEAASHAAWTP